MKIPGVFICATRLAPFSLVPIDIYQTPRPQAYAPYGLQNVRVETQYHLLYNYL